MNLRKPDHYSTFINQFDPLFLTGLGSHPHDSHALLWALVSGDLARRFATLNPRLHDAHNAIATLKELRRSSSWEKRVQTLRNLEYNGAFWRLLEYGTSAEEIEVVKVTRMHAVIAHDLLSTRETATNPAPLKRRRKKAVTAFTRHVTDALFASIVAYGKSFRA